MAERFLLAAWILSGWLILSLCLEHQYHFVNQMMKWTEAQSYCRKQHTDLATIGNSEDLNLVFNSILSTGYNSDTWIGLYSKINWTWSDGLKRSNPEYRNWEKTDGDPDFISASQFCVCIGDSGGWWDYNCTAECPFICNKGTPGVPEFVVVNQSMSWSNAQRYCKQNFIDLANIGNSTENQQVQRLVPTGYWAWTGLYRSENIYWSDHSSFTFSNWDRVSNLINSEVICGTTSTERKAKWKFLSCETRLPFVCQRVMKRVVKRVVRLKLKASSSVNLNDPQLKTKLLQKLQEELQEKGQSPLPLKFIVQPDGKVFFKEDKKKTEL
ncbi:hypothetical protein AMECASPLE_023851 [Ameca splendens]|uniref:C-type lectin domain-containing protein n=1 Tax=Ameca splendens TaxID=208324 RepID=A0ABV0YRQ8_9TELE